MARQLVRSTEALRAARKLTGVWLLASVSANMSGLVLQSMKCLIAERALVWARKLVRSVVGGLSILHIVGERGHEADGSGCHTITLYARKFGEIFNTFQNAKNVKDENFEREGDPQKQFVELSR